MRERIVWWSAALLDRAAGSLFLRRLWAGVRSIPPVGWILSRIARRMAPPGRHVWLRPSRGPNRGHWVLCDLRYELGYVRGDHEPWVAELLRTWLEPGDCFFDVGAHIGYFTLYAGRLVGPGGVVLALEPDRDNYQRLAANVARNGLADWVRAIPAAAAARPGHMRFRPASDASSRVSGKLVGAAAEADGGEYVDVEAVGLDRWASYRPRAIKVDVEGAEVEVLRGSGEILAARSAYWLIESHGSRQEEDVLGILQAHDYVVEVLAPQHPAYPDYRQRYVVGRPR